MTKLQKKILQKEHFNKGVLGKRSWWVLFVVFTMHNLEEIWAISTLPSGVGGVVMPQNGVTLASFVVAVLLITGLALFITIKTSRGLTSRWVLAGYLLVGALVFNALMHTSRAVAVFEYNPGLISAILLLLPACALVLWANRYSRFTKRSIFVALLSGVLLTVPIIVTALWLGAMLVELFV